MFGAVADPLIALRVAGLIPALIKYLYLCVWGLNVINEPTIQDLFIVYSWHFKKKMARILSLEFADMYTIIDFRRLRI